MLVWKVASNLSSALWTTWSYICCWVICNQSTASVGNSLINLYTDMTFTRTAINYKDGTYIWMSHKRERNRCGGKNTNIFLTHYCSRYKAHEESQMMQHFPGDGYSVVTLILLCYPQFTASKWTPQRLRHGWAEVERVAWKRIKNLTCSGV